MPRERQALRSQTMAIPESMVASAVSLSTMPSMAARLKHKAEAWQGDAWDFLDGVGEYSYSCNWVGNLLSKARLTVLENGEETTNVKAVEALTTLFGGADGHAEMFRMLGVHFTVAGEAYIFLHEDTSTGLDKWVVAPSIDVRDESYSNNGPRKWSLANSDTEFFDPLVLRLWRPHPRYVFKAHSPSRAVLPVLQEIFGLTQHVDAQINSRLAGAGLLILPSEMSFAGTQSTTGNGATSEPQNLNTFMATLTRTFSAAIGDRANPAATVPFMLQVAGDYVDKVRHLTFWSELDAKAIDLRTEAIRRLALGMDMPPEILTGTGDLNHWSSWQVEEAAIKAHSGPLLTVIVRALTVGYLHLHLTTGDDPMTVEQAEAFSFGVDDSEMRLRPNRSREALELYDRGALSMTALLRENGFDSTVDAPSEDDLKAYLLKTIAKGSSTPAMVEAANLALGVVLDIPREAIAIKGDTQEGRPTPSLEKHPVREPPKEVNPLAAAASVMVYRALERAGNRLRNKMGRKLTASGAAVTYQAVEISEPELDELLADAWSICTDMPGLGINADRLDSYTRKLLLTGDDLNMDELHAHLVS